MSPVKYEAEALVKGKHETFRLLEDGTFCKADGTILPWFKDEQTKKPWIPKKAKSFKSLVKQCAREGDFD